MIVHQFAPILEPGAVGTHTLVARDSLRAAGIESDIYTPEIVPAWGDRGGRLLGEYHGGADALVYQLAIGNVAADFVLARSEPLVVNYHNLTPLQYFRGWEPVAAWGVTWGRQQVRALADRATLGIAVSRYNEAELVEAGFARTTVVPFLLDPNALSVEPDETVSAELRGSRAGSQWLFVGRLAPNKAQEDVVKAFAAYRRFHDPDARLHLVGGGVDSTYGRSLTSFITALGLEEAVSLPGPVAPSGLAAYYRSCDVLVVCSEHEGFCVPLVEAMHHRLPIVAFAAAAVPETLGDAGILLDTKDACTVAAAVARLRRDDALRAQLVEAGAARVAQFDPARAGPEFVDAVTSAAPR